MKFEVIPDLTEKIHVTGSSGGWSYPKYLTIKYANGTSAKFEYMAKDVAKVCKELAEQYPCGATASDAKTNIGKKLVAKYGGETPQIQMPYYNSGKADYAKVGDYLVGYCELGRFKVAVYYKRV